LGHQGILVYFNSLRPVEPAHGTRCSFRPALSQEVIARAAMSQEAIAGAQGAHGDPRAAPGAGVMRHVVDTELP
jgi:hypothetical protein